MRREFQLKNLEIVGYGGVLAREFVPCVVPPIFMVKSAPSIVIMPPFRMEGEKVWDALPVQREDFEQAIRREQVTKLKEVIPAQAHHYLWVDEDLKPQYGPAAAVRKELQEKARQNVREAQRALMDGDLDKTLKFAQAAISADDRCLNAILLKACVYRMRQEPGKIEILAEIAEEIAPGTDLFSWVDLYAELRQPTKWPGFGGYAAIEQEAADFDKITQRLVAGRDQLLSLPVRLPQVPAFALAVGVS